MVSLLVSASVCVSWYHSLVSMSVRPTQFDPDPVSPLFPTPLSLVVSVYCQPQTPRFPGMLVEFRLFFQVTVVCALRGVSVNSHTGREINTLTLSHANLVTSQPTPCTVKNSPRLKCPTRAQHRRSLSSLTFVSVSRTCGIFSRTTLSSGLAVSELYHR